MKIAKPLLVFGTAALFLAACSDTEDLAELKVQTNTPPSCVGVTDANFMSTNGDDVLVGTNGPDIIFGLGGNDSICGLGGADELRGGGGNDELRGSNGDDTLNGGSGNDVLNGGNDNDSLVGGDGNDQLVGSNGDDRLSGGAGNDRYAGGSKDMSDTFNINGPDGNTAGAGNDVIADFDTKSRDNETTFDRLIFTFDGVRYVLSTTQEFIDFVNTIESDGRGDTDAVVRNNDLFLVFSRNGPSGPFIDSVRLRNIVDDFPEGSLSEADAR